MGTTLSGNSLGELDLDFGEVKIQGWFSIDLARIGQQHINYTKVTWKEGKVL